MVGDIAGILVAFADLVLHWVDWRSAHDSLQARPCVFSVLRMWSNMGGFLI